MNYSTREIAALEYWRVSRAIHGRDSMTVRQALDRLHIVEIALYMQYPPPYGLIKRINQLQVSIVVGKKYGKAK